jgi:NOL1/NOP2/sun family putative RNA methylase
MPLFWYSLRDIMKHISPEKIQRKRSEWVARVAAALAVDEATALQLLTLKRQQSIRLNPLKADPAQTLQNLKKAGWRGLQYGWMPLGYTIDSPIEAVRDSRPVLQGEAYIQNASSWLPVLALDPRPGDRVLDVCAAPGGKTSHIAAATSNQSHIWANDNGKGRLAKLRANTARLGASVERFTFFDALALSRKLEGERFDKILVDAPCSGEGEKDITDDRIVAEKWSVAQIKRLQHTQKGIITQAWRLLATGGTLVYSTCTISPEENEGVIDYLLRSQEDAMVVPFSPELPNSVPRVQEWNGKHYNPAVDGCLRLAPSEQLEAFFVCKLQKILPIG